jgi:hypothetical protein
MRDGGSRTVLGPRGGGGKYGWHIETGGRARIPQIAPENMGAKRYHLRAQRLYAAKP